MLSFWEIVLIGIGLSMDAFAVAISEGLKCHHISYKRAGMIASLFGFFQAFMPLIGYFVSSSVQNIVTNISHLLSGLLLIFLGIKMLKESSRNLTSSKSEKKQQTLLMLAIATSLDALACRYFFWFLRYFYFPNHSYNRLYYFLLFFFWCHAWFSF